jgi:ABC-type transport system involved in multi-copper enzyme maturation permease subunit
MTTTAPYRSELPTARDDFGQLLHAEWTKFRTVRGWLITSVAAAILIVGFAYLGTFHHQNGVCTTPSPSSCSVPKPHVPLGPGGEAVTDTYYLVHRTLAGDGTITVRVGSLSGLMQSGGNGHATSVADLAGTPGPLQPWAKAGLIVTTTTKPGSAYAAVTLTGAHGVRMQYDYTHDTAGPAAAGRSPRWLRLTRTGDTLTGYESADGAHWTEIRSAHLGRLPTSVQVGLFVTSPPTAPSQKYFAGDNAGGLATGATASFDSPILRGQSPSGGWTGQEVGADGQVPTVSSVGYHRSATGFTISGSGDIAPAVGQAIGYTDGPSLTGVFVGLIAMIVLATMFITVEYRRGLIRTTFAASPRRGQVLAAKAIVIATVTFLVGAAAIAVSIPLGNHLLRADGNYVYPTSTLTDLRVIVGTAALLALAAVLALALGTALRRSAAAITAVILLIVLPDMLVVAVAVPTGVQQWLMRVTPAAAFAVEQTVPQYHQVNYLYSPSNGFYPLAPAVGLAVLLAYTAAALWFAGHRLRRRDA